MRDHLDENVKPAPVGRSAPGDLVLEARSLGYRAGPNALLEDINLTLRPGGPTVLMGPNGAGKSLLLRLLHGMIAPTSGGVLVNGEALSTAHRAKQAMVFQRPVLLRRTVASNLDYVLRRTKLNKQARLQAIDQALSDAGLARKAKQSARTLSGGEQQRLALVRAMAMAPEVLFLDEPTSNLDPSATQAIEALVARAAQRGSKVVMVSHDPGQARRVAADIVFLNHGRVAEHTPADAFFDAPRTPAARAFLSGDLLV